jgi:hypothetical protein
MNESKGRGTRVMLEWYYMALERTALDSLQHRVDQIRARGGLPTPEAANDNQLYSVNGSGTPSGLSAKVFILIAIRL